MLVVAGKFDEAKALAADREVLRRDARSPTRKLDKTYTEEPPQDGERSVTLRRVGDVGVVAASITSPRAPHRRLRRLECWPTS